MEQQSFGKKISLLRKEKGLTQMDLAEKMGVTDKAVSKWERDLSYPDVESIPKLAEILGISLDSLFQNREAEDRVVPAKKNAEQLMILVLKALALAMGIAVMVMPFMNTLHINSAVSMIGIGITCLSALNLLQK